MVRLLQELRDLILLLLSGYFVEVLLHIGAGATQNSNGDEYVVVQELGRKLLDLLRTYRQKTISPQESATIIGTQVQGVLQRHYAM